jgi:hypothetical protein
MTTQVLYQRIYDDPHIGYGRAEKDMCPGTRFFPFYRHFLRGRIVDFGCGTGDTLS